MRNVELKARCADLDAVRARAERLGARWAGDLEQRDTFFAAGTGRLKLRQLGDGRAELIAYRRPDAPEARGSDYEIYTLAPAAQAGGTLAPAAQAGGTLAPAAQADGLVCVLAHALGTTGVVEKRRCLYLFERTRIHLDRVRGLGEFVELETVVTDQPDAAAHAELARVAAALELRADDVVAEAYVDLLARGGPR